MRIVRWILGGSLLGCLVGGCGGNAEPAAGDPANEAARAGSGNADGTVGAGNAGTGQGGSPGSVHPSNLTQPPSARVPQKHRAAAVVCDDERPRDEVPPLYSSTPPDAVACDTDTDCPPPAECADCRAACTETEEGDRFCITLRGDGCAQDEHCTRGDNGRCEDFRGDWRCTYDECFADASCNQGGPCACEGGFWSDSNVCLPGNCRTDADCGSAGYCSPTFGDCGGYSGVIGYYCHTAQDTCLDDADCTANGSGYCMYRPELAHWACGYGQCVG